MCYKFMTEDEIIKHRRRYASIREMDISNGTGVGMSVFLQGCHFHCKNCFNQETWDFNGGFEWTKEIEDNFFKLLLRPYITRLSILGGEPLERPYLTMFLLEKVRGVRPDINIWIYSGYTFEEIIRSHERTRGILFADVLVDGRYIDELKDPTLKFRGSSNQRIIDVKKSLETGTVVQIY